MCVVERIVREEDRTFGATTRCVEMGVRGAVVGVVELARAVISSSSIVISIVRSSVTGDGRADEEDDATEEFWAPTWG